MEVRLVSIKDLKKKKNNRNHHPQSQIDRLAELIKFYGFVNPIIVSNLSGEIVAGNGRYLAAIRAGLKEVPVIYKDFKNLDEEYGYHVSDNGISLWSELDMSGINTDIADLGPDFNIDMLGISDFTLDVSEIEIKENENQNETYNFTIKCKSKDENDFVKEKFNTNGTKISFQKFKEIYENSNN